MIFVSIMNGSGTAVEHRPSNSEVMGLPSAGYYFSLSSRPHHFPSKSVLFMLVSPQAEQVRIRFVQLKSVVEQLLKGPDKAHTTKG